MKIAIFDSHKFEGRYFELANKKFNHELNFFNFRLTDETVKIASGFPCVCCFVNDELTKKKAFLTDEALMEIAYTTLDNVKQFELQRDLTNQVSL